LRRDRNEAADAETKRRLDGEIAAVEKRVADNQADVAARAAGVARKYREDQETRQAHEEAGKAAAQKGREANEAEAKAQRDAEEAARPAEAEAQRAEKEAKAQAAADKLEKDRFDALSPDEKHMREELARAQAAFAAKEAEYEKLSPAEQNDPKNQ